MSVALLKPRGTHLTTFLAWPALENTSRRTILDAEGNRRIILGQLVEKGRMLFLENNNLKKKINDVRLTYGFCESSIRELAELVNNETMNNVNMKVFNNILRARWLFAFMKVRDNKNITNETTRPELSQIMIAKVEL
jgi:hypothetical protein